MLNNWPIFSHDISVDLNVHMAVNYHTITHTYMALVPCLNISGLYPWDNCDHASS